MLDSTLNDETEEQDFTDFEPRVDGVSSATSHHQRRHDHSVSHDGIATCAARAADPERVGVASSAPHLGAVFHNAASAAADVADQCSRCQCRQHRSESKTTTSTSSTQTKVCTGSQVTSKDGTGLDQGHNTKENQACSRDKASQSEGTSASSDSIGRVKGHVVSGATNGKKEHNVAEVLPKRDSGSSTDVPVQDLDSGSSTDVPVQNRDSESSSDVQVQNRDSGSSTDVPVQNRDSESSSDIQVQNRESSSSTVVQYTPAPGESEGHAATATPEVDGYDVNVTCGTIIKGRSSTPEGISSAQEPETLHNGVGGSEAALDSSGGGQEGEPGSPLDNSFSSENQELLESDRPDGAKEDLDSSGADTDKLGALNFNSVLEDLEDSSSGDDEFCPKFEVEDIKTLPQASGSLITPRDNKFSLTQNLIIDCDKKEGAESGGHRNRVEFVIDSANADEDNVGDEQDSKLLAGKSSAASCDAGATNHTCACSCHARDRLQLPGAAARARLRSATARKDSAGGCTHTHTHTHAHAQTPALLQEARSQGRKRIETNNKAHNFMSPKGLKVGARNSHTSVSCLSGVSTGESECESRPHTPTLQQVRPAHPMFVHCQPCVFASPVVNQTNLSIPFS